MKDAHASAWVSIKQGKSKLQVKAPPSTTRTIIRKKPIKIGSKKFIIAKVKESPNKAKCTICGKDQMNMNAHLISAHLKEITRPVRSLKMPRGITSVSVRKNVKGEYRNVLVVFGPYYFVEIRHNKGGHLVFILGATKHGFETDATEVNGGHEKIINEIREAHPDIVVN